MDLGIKGKRALLCASSRGLGLACATALAREGVNVVINGLDSDRLKDSAQLIRESTDVEVTSVAADINTEEGRMRLLAACPEPDMLVTNNMGPPPGDFHDWDRLAWLQAVEANMLAPILLIQAVVDGMSDRKFGRIINITSAMVKAPRPHMGLSSAARAGLTAFSKGLSGLVAKDNVTINNLLPERIDTDRQIQQANRVMKLKGISFAEAREEQVQSIAAKRLGRPEEFGAACAFLCSEHAGFISGQNINIDGGSYPGLI